MQYRKKISSKVFKHLSSVLLNEFYTDNELSIKRWNGFRLLAVDGSRLNLPKTKKLSVFYGETKNQNESENMVDELKDIFKKYIIPIRPNRKFERNTVKYRRRRKPKTTKNQKDTF